jgi:hypothetical protein
VKTLPANRDAIVLMYQSLNSPQVGIPGKQAGPAQSFVVGYRGQSGGAMFIFLYLPESGESAVYISDNRNMSDAEMVQEENEALGFVESMGFMMDNLYFTNMAVEQKDDLMRSLPPFVGSSPKAAPTATPKQAEAKKSPAALLGRILSSF